MSNELILFRTHKFNFRIDAVLSRLVSRSGRAVVVVADEREKTLNIPQQYTKVSLNRESILQLGLTCPDDVGWRCGDYAFYLTLDISQKYDYIWLVEHDLHVNWSREADFFDAFSDIEHDFLGVGFRKASSHWSWHARMARFAPDVYFCLFPLVRLSRLAAEALLSSRQMMSLKFPSELSGDYPNDESFVASSLMAQKFQCASFNDFGRKYYELDETFSLQRPFSRGALESAAPDRLVYHPALYGDDFANKAKAFISKSRSLEKINAFSQYIDQYAANECSPDTVSALLKSIDAAQQALLGQTTPFQADRAL